jgi:hypothetical protein
VDPLRFILKWVIDKFFKKLLLSLLSLLSTFISSDSMQSAGDPMMPGAHLLLGSQGLPKKLSKELKCIVGLSIQNGLWLEVSNKFLRKLSQQIHTIRRFM